MEPTSALPKLSFRKVPREGQSRVLDEVAARRRGSLNVKLPTGYGKTFTAIASYSLLREAGEVNRLLYIVPTVAQLDQFLNDTETIRDANVPQPWTISDFGFNPAAALKAHLKNSSHIFACTVQSLLSAKTLGLLHSMMSNCLWMIVVDEYHHYGVDARWGRVTSGLPHVFRLAMSATPYRPTEDGAFGAPDVVVTYREAAEQGAVKRLACHSYTYQIDAILENGELKRFTTQGLVAEVGSSEPNEIDRYRAERQMRWSPKYVSPLVDAPIARIVRERLETGMPLQVLVGAMCCSHAKMVYEQIRDTYSELRVEWVGTGEYGRPDEENRAALAGFCPKKRPETGERSPADVTVDVLVHVGMAGEGLDSTYVTEVVHLNPANLNNSNNQENGRAARVISGVQPSRQIARINVDSRSDYAEYVGESVMDAMDMNPPGDKGNPPGDPGGEPLPPLPESPSICIVDVTCIRIDEGEVNRLKEAYVERHVARGHMTRDEVMAVMANRSDPIHAEVEQLYREMRMREAERFNGKSELLQWGGAVESALGQVTRQAIRKIVAGGATFNKDLPRDIKKRINREKCDRLGSKIGADVPELKRHYGWLKTLERTILEKGLPEWLL